MLGVGLVHPIHLLLAFLFHINNPAAKDIYLISASTSISESGELHSVIQKGDVFSMQQVKQIKIPAKSEDLSQTW